MNKIDELKALIPSFILDPINDELFTQYGIELESLDENSVDLLLQLFPQTATWGIKLWEELLNLPVNEDLNIGIRRNKVMSILAVNYPMNIQNFSSIIAKFAEKTEVIQNFNTYTLDIKLISQTAFNVVLSDITKAIENIKPAHLGYLFNLETRKTINIAATREAVFGSHIDLCGAFNCGDSNVVSSYGRSYSSGLTLHGDYSKNIKDYALAGTILSSLNSEFENGIAIIGRFYASIANIVPFYSYLFDDQLSKTHGDILGTIYSKLMKVATSYNNAINTYEEAGNENTGQFMTGSNENFNTAIGKTYSSNIQEDADETNTIKEYKYAGEIIVSTEEVL